MTSSVRHRPPSHPVLRAVVAEGARIAQMCEPETPVSEWLRERPPVELPPDGVLPPLSQTAVARMSDSLAQVAEAILHLPPQPLTIGQRREAKVMAAELMRRATTDER